MVAYATKQPCDTMKHMGPLYLASVIAAFQTLVRTERAAPTQPYSLDDRTHYVAAVVLPLTEFLAARGLIETLPVVEWLLAGGALSGSFPKICQCFW